jgi:hypothetical protein
MPLKNNGPGGCCCAPPTVSFTVTLYACGVGPGALNVDSIPLQSGVAVTVYLGGVSVGTGTTGGLGAVTIGGLNYSTAYTIAASGYGASRYVSPTSFTTPSSGGTVSVTIVPAAGYICTAICLFPLSNRMVFTTGAGSQTLAWGYVSGVYGYFPASSGIPPSSGSPLVPDSGSSFSWLYSAYFGITLTGVTTCVFAAPVATTFTSGMTVEATMTETTPVP